MPIVYKPPPGGPIATTSIPWAENTVDTIVAVLNAAETMPAFAFLSGEIHAIKEAINVKSMKDFWTDVTTDPDKVWTDFEVTPFTIVAWIIQKVTGLTITGPQVEQWANGPDVATQRSSLGKILTDMYGETLKPEAAAAGWLARDPGTAEWENFRQLSGAAMRIQVGDLLIGWFGKAIPFGIGSGLGDIAEKINDAIALDDALEEVVQVPMQAVIQRGLEAYYNRKLKPVDYTNSDAMKAFIAGIIDRPTLDKILDNTGLRDDIRDTMIDFAGTNLTESDINDLYQHNVFDREQVKDQYRQKYFQEEERELKTVLVEKTRRWKLEEKIFELYGNLYRDGVATKQEVRPFLEHFGYDPDEIDMWFSVQELERKQRKWLPIGKVNVLAKSGKWTVQEAVDYLVLQGMTPDDALNDLRLDDTPLTRNDIIRLVGNGSMGADDGLMRMMVLGYNRADAELVLSDAILEDALRQIPKKIRDKCLGEHYERTQLLAALTVAQTLNPEVIFKNSHFVTEAQCILEAYNATGPVTPPPLPTLPGPTALVVQPSAGENRLSWQPVDGALYYTVSRKDNPWGVFIALSPPTFNTYMVDKGLMHGTWYYYRVTGNVNDVETEPSDVVLAVGL